MTRCSSGIFADIREQTLGWNQSNPSDTTTNLEAVMAENLTILRKKARDFDRIIQYLKSSQDNVVRVDCEAVAATRAGLGEIDRADAIQQQVLRLAATHGFKAKCINATRVAKKAAQPDEATVMEDDSIMANAENEAEDTRPAAESREEREGENAVIDPNLFNLDDDTK